MVSDLPGTLVDLTGIEPLDGFSDARVQALFARGRDAGKQSLSHKFVREGERLLRSLGAWDDYSHPLRFLDHRKEFVDIDPADLSQELKTETAPDHSGGCQHPPL